MTYLQDLWNLYGLAFVSGAEITLQLTAVAIVLGATGGLALAVLRLYGPRPLAVLEIAYVEFWRGTPLLIQLFLVYYALPALGMTLDPMPAAFVTLGLNSAAYQAEYFRGAVQSVDAGQTIAALAIGMGRLATIRYVVLPQALRLVIPAWSNEVIGTLKATAVVFLIAIPDLMGQAKIIFGRTFNPVEAYMTVSVVYLLLVGVFIVVLSRVERRLFVPGLGSSV